MENCKNLKLPPIGYGTFPQKENLVDNVSTAVDCGYRLIDTSDNYVNEEYVGRGLKNICCSGKNVIVISKFSQPFRTASLSTCFQESNSKLSGRLNIYLLHWPFPFLWKRQWKAMENLYLEGKCDAIGVCNFEKKHLKKLFKFCRVKPFIDQFECHPMFQQKETSDFCKKNGIQVMSYSPVARMNKKLIENETLLSIARKYDKSVTQVILRWNVEHGFIPIPAASSERHMKENIDIFDFSLTESEVKDIDSLECGFRIRFDPDKRFGMMQKLRFLKVYLKLALS